MEQLVAREAHNLEVGGSSPSPATTKRIMRSLSQSINEAKDTFPSHAKKIVKALEKVFGKLRVDMDGEDTWGISNSAIEEGDIQMAFQGANSGFDDVDTFYVYSEGDGEELSSKDPKTLIKFLEEYVDKK